MSNKIKYFEKDKAHDDLLTQKPSSKATLSTLTASVQNLYDRLHEFIDEHHSSSPGK
tara:strand:+ start:4917 stop:5087 length:171 start_codon:yes stop_codon:yes gene_type:complete